MVEARYSRKARAEWLWSWRMLLSPRAYWTLHAINHHIDDDEGDCWVSIETLADGPFGQTAVKAGLQEARSLGLVVDKAVSEIHRPKGSQPRAGVKCNGYQITLKPSPYEASGSRNATNQVVAMRPPETPQVVVMRPDRWSESDSPGSRNATTEPIPRTLPIEPLSPLPSPAGESRERERLQPREQGDGEGEEGSLEASIAVASPGLSEQDKARLPSGKGIVETRDLKGVSVYEWTDTEVRTWCFTHQRSLLDQDKGPGWRSLDSAIGMYQKNREKLEAAKDQAERLTRASAPAVAYSDASPESLKVDDLVTRVEKLHADGWTSEEIFESDHIGVVDDDGNKELSYGSIEGIIQRYVSKTQLRARKQTAQ